MEESPLNSFGQTRLLKDAEKTLLRRLLDQLEGDDEWTGRLDTFEVKEMPDGGMGILCFVSPGNDLRNRQFGRRIAELQFNDADGVPIIASLNVDTDGSLYELDIWRTDFNRVIRLSPS